MLGFTEHHDQDDLRRVGDLREAVLQAREQAPQRHGLQWPACLRGVYKSYREAFMDSAYQLSEMELAALCRCTRTNVVIFKHALATGTLEYCQHRISDAGAPVVYTSVEDHGGG